MAERLNFREAVARAGVSRQRLNDAIKSGRLPAVRGGGPGKPTSIDLTDLQAWCVREGLAMPVESLERSERLGPGDLTRFIERFHDMVEGMERLERLVEQTIERLERSADLAITQGLLHARESLKASAPIERSETSRALIIARIRRAKDEEMKSFQMIAKELNAEGILTFSGKGLWHKGNVERFYRGK